VTRRQDRNGGALPASEGAHRAQSAHDTNPTTGAGFVREGGRARVGMKRRGPPADHSTRVAPVALPSPVVRGSCGCSGWGHRTNVRSFTRTDASLRGARACERRPGKCSGVPPPPRTSGVRAVRSPCVRLVRSIRPWWLGSSDRAASNARRVVVPSAVASEAGRMLIGHDAPGDRYVLRLCAARDG
jgi:hypothetical protein